MKKRLLLLLWVAYGLTSLNRAAFLTAETDNAATQVKKADPDSQLETVPLTAASIDTQPANETERTDFDLNATLHPALPLDYEYNEQGVIVTCKKTLKNATIYYRAYNELSGANSVGTLTENKPLFCPYNSSLCFWVRYDSGIYSRATVFYADKCNKPRVDDQPLMQIFSPQEGNWGKELLLNVSAAPDTMVYYSLDGSDPQTSGQIFVKPFVIDKRGIVTVNLKAVSKSGKMEAKKITYSVGKRGKMLSPSFYFLTEMPPPNKNQSEKKELYSVLQWNYLEFLLQSPLKYELSASENVPETFPAVSKTYNGPLFLPRTEDIYVYWSCDEVESGAVQKIFLPKKPALTVSNNAEEPATAEPVTLEFSDPRYTYTFTAADKFPAIEPTLNSFRITDGSITFAVEPDEQLHYRLRVRAFYNGIAQGDYYEDFTIDKKRPPAVVPQFSTEQTITNDAVTMTFPPLPPDADYVRVIKITPSAKQPDDNTYMLGSDSSSTSYRILAYHEDAAQNKSEIFQRDITVAPLAVYVDSSAPSNGDGTAAKPLKNIDSAMKLISSKKVKAGSKKIWTVFLKGSFTLTEPIFISDMIDFAGQDGQDTVVQLGTNVGFVIENTKVNFSNLTFKRSENENEPRTVPIIYAAGSSVNLSGLKFITEYDCNSLSFFDSTVVMDDIRYSTVQSRYTECMLFSKCECILNGLDITAKGQSLIALSFDETLCQLTNANITLTANTAGRVIDAHNRSGLTVSNFKAVRTPDVYNKDTCIYVEEHSAVETDENVSIIGFKHEKN